jgi:phosphoglycerate kinase
MPYHTIDDLNFFNKKVVIRLDLNLPFKDGKILDNTRILKALPTLQRIIQNAPKRLVILTHLGRPKGEHNEAFTLKSVADELSHLLKREVIFEAEPISKILSDKLNKLPDGSVVMLENIRFYKGEETNDLEFSKLLGSLGDVFVNEAFSCSHRAHASVVGITKYLLSYAGIELNAEVKALESILTTPKKPVLGIVAGSKVSTKIDLLTNLLDKLDYLFVGGGMANTILAAKGYNLGKSLVEHESLKIAEHILEHAQKSSCELLLPLDVVVANNLDSSAKANNLLVSEVSSDQAIYDVGTATIKNLENILSICQTVLWNGPVGVYEVSPFDKGSLAIAKMIAEFTKKNGLKSIAGGGDTVAVIAKANLHGDFSYISTAGGAFLEWLEGKELPGIACLKI